LGLDAQPRARHGGRRLAHPLPDGNKRCAFLATVEFVERNRRTWVPAPGDPDETDRVIRAVASGDLSEADFRDWIADRCA
jgi:death on curing protein